MRFLAGIYLAIALTNFWLWLNNGLEVELFTTASDYLTWTLFVFILLSLFAYTMKMRILPQRVWQVVFLVYCATRLYELQTRGLAMSGVDLASDLNIVSSYLWLAFPPGMAMWYMGFVSHTPEPISEQPSKSQSKQYSNLHSNLHSDQHSDQQSSKTDHHNPLRSHYTEQLP